VHVAQQKTGDVDGHAGNVFRRFALDNLFRGLRETTPNFVARTGRAQSLTPASNIYVVDSNSSINIPAELFATAEPGRFG